MEVLPSSDFSGEVGASGASGASVGVGVVDSVVVVIIGHPICSSFSASVIPSEQQPNKLSTHSAGGHPLNFSSSAGDKPSGQHPYLVSLHVSGTGHPSSNGPVAAVVLSEQQPYVDFKHAATFGLGLHFFGVCSLVTMASRVFGVVPNLSSSSVESDAPVVDQISTSFSVLDPVDPASVLSVSPVPEDVVSLSSVPSEPVELPVVSVVIVDESISDDVDCSKNRVS